MTMIIDARDQQSNSRDRRIWRRRSWSSAVVMHNEKVYYEATTRGEYSCLLDNPTYCGSTLWHVQGDSLSR